MKQNFVTTTENYKQNQVCFDNQKLSKYFWLEMLHIFVASKIKDA